MNRGTCQNPVTCQCPQCANYREMLEESIQDELCDAGFYAQICRASKMCSKPRSPLFVDLNPWR